MRIYIVWLLSLIGLGTGCSTTEVEVTKESDAYFSMYGVLDASADTQFVRIKNLREVHQLTKAPLKARVQLHDLTLNKTVELEDTVIQNGNGFWVHNFWTTYPIQKGGRYQLVAENAQGQKTTATIQVPAKLPRIELINPWSLRNPSMEVGQYVAMGGHRQFLGVQVDYVLRTTANGEAGRKLEKTYTWFPETAADTSVVAFRAPQHLREISGRQNVNASHLEVSQINVSVYGTNEALILARDVESLAISKVATNVQNGTGLVVGTIRFQTRWTDLETYLNQWLHSRGPWSN